jgi:thiol-disulfide isomerase/thioredoxin
MDVVWTCIVVGTLVLVTSTGGLIWRRRQGRAVSVRAVHRVSASDLTLDSASPAIFGTDATLLQFSAEFCGQCPATRRLLSGLASEETQSTIRHIDIDLTHRPDMAARYHVLQTPTTLVLDGEGQVRARIGGPPRRPELIDLLERIQKENHDRTVSR